MHLNLTIIIKSLCNIIEIPVARTHTCISNVCLRKNLPFHDTTIQNKTQQSRQTTYTLCLSISSCSKVLVFLTIKISMNYSDHEDMNPCISTQIHLFSHTVMHNFQPSFIVYTKMFSERIYSVLSFLVTQLSTVCMGARLIKMMYI